MSLSKAYMTSLKYALERNLKTDLFVIKRTCKNIKLACFALEDNEQFLESVVKLLDEFLNSEQILFTDMKMTFSYEDDPVLDKRFKDNVDCIRRLKLFAEECLLQKT